MYRTRGKRASYQERFDFADKILASTLQAPLPAFPKALSECLMLQTSGRSSHANTLRRCQLSRGAPSMRDSHVHSITR